METERGAGAGAVLALTVLALTVLAAGCCSIAHSRRPAGPV